MIQIPSKIKDLLNALSNYGEYIQDEDTRFRFYDLIGELEDEIFDVLDNLEMEIINLQEELGGY